MNEYAIRAVAIFRYITEFSDNNKNKIFHKQLLVTVLPDARNIGFPPIFNVNSLAALAGAVPKEAYERTINRSNPNLMTLNVAVGSIALHCVLPYTLFTRAA